MALIDTPITGSGTINGNAGSGGSDYVVTCGTGITSAVVTNALGATIYTFTGVESRGMYITAGAYSIAVVGTGTVRIERVYS